MRYRTPCKARFRSVANLYRVGVEPTGLHRKVSVRYIEPPPFPGLSWRYGKLPRDRHDAHRPIRKDEDLNAIFAWREYRKVTDSLTLRYERKMYLIQDRRAIDV